MVTPLAEMQKLCCSTDALNIANAVTLKDVLHNDGPASVLIKRFLKLEDKRSLRLVCHAGKDAVDKTVTAVCMPRMLPEDYCRAECVYNYASILSNSNWKDIKKVKYSPLQGTLSIPYVEPQGLTQIAKAGLSKLESLTLRFHGYEENVKDADALVQAGWKLKQLDIARYGVPAEWLNTLVRDANWPLEELTVHECNKSIATCIAAAEWKLKKLYLLDPYASLHSESVETLMQASWVSSVERLTLTFNEDSEKKGTRAIAQASHRALNLIQLEVMANGYQSEHALILLDGSYPKLKRLRTKLCLNWSTFAAILRKYPELEEFECYGVGTCTRYDVDDPEDAKLVAAYYKKGIVRVTGYGDSDKVFKLQLEFQLKGCL